MSRQPLLQASHQALLGLVLLGHAEAAAHVRALLGERDSLGPGLAVLPAVGGAVGRVVDGDDLAAEVEEGAVAGAEGAGAVLARLHERLLALAPRGRIQRVPADVAQQAHLVLVGPAAGAAVHEAVPEAVGRAQELRALVDAVLRAVALARDLPRVLRVRDHDGAAGRARGVLELHDEKLLHEVRGFVRHDAVFERPARVDEVQFVVER